ncbi:MAG: OmpH family outer membrane protein [Pseudomonadota bacterium]
MKLLAFALAICLGGAAMAQEAGAPAVGVPRSPIVVLDQDALFSGSLFGRRVVRDIDAANRELEMENRRIEGELEREERDLTERRTEMEPDAFRELASEFDARVTDIRRTQDAKSRAVQQQFERAQALFLERANPVLIALAQETGALVILDRRIVIAAADQVDMTDLALARIDAALGEGAGLLAETPAPVPRPSGPEIAPAEPAGPEADESETPATESPAED